MAQFDGYLFAKLAAINSRSEGPVYFLQQFDYKEYPVIKQVHPWQEDSNLHPFLNKKVSIEGEMSYSGIEYKKIGEFKPERTAVADTGENRLNVTLETKPEVVWVNKMPPGPNPPQFLELAMSVEWPYRSIWEGYCPTAQLYDFWIELDGKPVLRWSDGKVFAQVITPVRIPGGSPCEFTEVWKIDPAAITVEGVYTAYCLFIASGQEAKAEFEMKFAH